MTRCARILGAALLWAAGLIGTSAAADPQTAAIPHNTVENGTAVHGYDVVAYFVMRRPVKGNPAYKATYAGAVWYFASDVHRTAFLARPERYVPQYGGYCASRMRAGIRSDINPHAWAIHGGRLFLMENADEAAEWRRNPPENARLADEAWSRLIGG